MSDQSAKRLKMDLTAQASKQIVDATASIEQRYQASVVRLRPRCYHSNRLHAQQASKVERLRQELATTIPPSSQLDELLRRLDTAADSARTLPAPLTGKFESLPSALCCYVIQFLRPTEHAGLRLVSRQLRAVSRLPSCTFHAAVAFAPPHVAAVVCTAAWPRVLHLSECQPFDKTGSWGRGFGLFGGGSYGSEQSQLLKQLSFNAALVAELRGRVHTVDARGQPTWKALIRELAPDLTHVFCNVFELQTLAKVTLLLLCCCVAALCASH